MSVAWDDTMMAVSLPRYAERVAYSECAFFGVRNPADDTGRACRAIWTQEQREMLVHALIEAQLQIEAELGYFLTPRWVTEEWHRWTPRIMAHWGHLIEPGVRSFTLVQAGITPTWASDPEEITIDLDGRDPEEIVFVFAGTETPVLPTGYDEDPALGTATYYFPWCRLVDPDYTDNPEEGWDYVDVATWGASGLDAYHVTTDSSTQATLVWRGTESDICGTEAGCSNEEETGCIVIHNAEVGSLEVVRADYADGTWTRTSMCREPDWVLLNYRAGLLSVPRLAEDAIIRLAHTLLPEEPCGCEVTQRLWRRDRNEPQLATAERLNCPFGLSDGAWMAWTFARRMRLLRGSMV